MKKFLLIALIAVIALTPLAVAACSRVSQQDMLTNPYVTEGSEVFSYKMYYGNEAVGTMTMTFTKLTKADVTLPHPASESKEKSFTSFTGTQLSMAYKLNNVFSTDEVNIYKDDEASSVVLYTDDYAPVYSYKKEKFNGVLTEKAVEYESKYAYTYLYENGAPAKTAEVKVKNTTHFDNEMIYAIIRASGISQTSYSFSFASPNANLGALETISISKMSDTTINIPLLATAEKADTDCALFRIAISNNYAPPFSINVAKDPVTLSESVKNVKKAILQINEEDCHYVLENIQVIG